MTDASMKRAVEAAKQQAQKTTAAKATVKKEENKKFAQIQTNTFAQILFDGKKSLEEKKKDLVNALSIDETKSKIENLARLEEFNLFKEFMQERRKEQAMDMISALDTGVFGNLQKVIDDMNQGVIDFGKSMEPLMKIIDAVHLLRNAGATNDVFAEIKDYEAAEAKRLEALAKKEEELRAASEKVEKLEANIRDLQTNKQYRNFFGNIKKAYVAEAQLKETVDLPKAKAEVARLAGEAETLSQPTGSTSKFDDNPEVVAAKEQLRQMLNLTSEEHRGQQEELINVAKGFVNMSDERIAEVMSHFGSLKDQLQEVDKNVNGTQKVYALLTSATVDVNKRNQELGAKYDAPVLADGETEDELDRIRREEMKSAIDEHIQAMTTSSIDTATVSKDLAKDSFTIKTMRDKTTTQINNTRALQSSGVAKVATSLASTLQAINSAAINESTKSAEISLKLIDDKATAVMMNEAIKDATGAHEMSNKMKEAIDELTVLREGIQSVTEITTAGMKEALESKNALEDLVNQVKQEVVKAKAVTSDVAKEFNNAASNDNGETTVVDVKKTAAPKKSKPLDFGSI